MDLNELMQQAQKMQQDMQTTEKELKSKRYTESVGGGVVEVTLSGDLQIENISIEEELLSIDNKAILEDMIQMAINNALQKATSEKEDKMASLTSGMNMSGLF